MCGVVAESYQGEGKDQDMDWYRNLTLMAVAALENDVKTVTKLISAGCDPADNQTAFFAGQAGSFLSETVSDSFSRFRMGHVLGTTLLRRIHSAAPSDRSGISGYNLYDVISE